MAKPSSYFSDRTVPSHAHAHCPGWGLAASGRRTVAWAVFAERGDGEVARMPDAARPEADVVSPGARSLDGKGASKRYDISASAVGHGGRQPNLGHRAGSDESAACRCNCLEEGRSMPAVNLQPSVSNTRPRRRRGHKA